MTPGRLVEASGGGAKGSRRAGRSDQPCLVALRGLAAHRAPVVSLTWDVIDARTARERQRLDDRTEQQVAGGMAVLSRVQQRGMPCPHCHAPLPTGARKCAACGEWIEGREPLVATDILFLTLLTIEIVALGVMTFHWVPSLRAMYADFGSTAAPPAFSSLVLGRWWCPAWMLLVAGLAAVAVAPPRRSRTRAWIFGAALLLGVGAGALTWWGAMQPIFQMADSIKAD